MARFRMSAPAAAGGTDMEWTRFNIADGVAVSSVGVVSATQDAGTGVITVELDNTDTRKVGSGYLLGFNLPAAWNWDELQWAAVAIEKVGAGVDLGNSQFYVGAGIALEVDSGFDRCGWVGIMQDSGTATSLDIGVLLSTADTTNPSYSGAQSNVVGVIGEFAIGPGARLLNCTASSVSSFDPLTWKYSKRATATTAISATDSDFGFVLACGIDSSGSGNSTMSFRAHYLLSGRQSDWFKDNDG